MVIMQKKSITFLIMTVFTSLFLVGCHGEETIDNLKSTIETVGKFADSLAQINDEASESRSSDSVTGYANEESDDESAKTSSKSIGILTKASDIELTDVDGKGKNYVFSYADESFYATYTTDNWKIIDSYKITNKSDLIIICQALIDAHPVHGSDKENYRTAEDMAYEWTQHNMAYELLSDDTVWKQKSKDVDLNPEDQGKTFIEIYEDRTGKKFDIREFLNKSSGK